MKDYLQKLKNVCAGKKVVIYCNGEYFDNLTNSFNLSEYFNITGVSDLRYETSPEVEYKGFQVIKPSDLNRAECDYILIASPNYSNIERFLSSLDVEAKILPLYTEPRRVNVKENYEKVLRNLKTKEKIRVLFICEENAKWSYSALYKMFLSGSRFEVLPVVLFPIITKSRVEFTQDGNAEFFREAGIPTVDGYDYDKKQNRDLKEFQPDIVFYEQPWYLEGTNHPEKVSEYALTCLVPYGYTTLRPNEWGSNLVKRVYSSLWRFFSESPYHNEFYKKATGMDDESLVAVGSLKLDCYNEPPPPRPRKYCVIWAPHHSINNDGLRMSTFKDNYKKFLEFAKEHEEYSFVLKPHPALRNACLNSGIDYDGFIREWNNLPNASVYDKGNYFDLFKSSDVMITDCSSFLAEYFPSENPIIFLNRPDRAPFDDFGEKLREGFYEANSFEEAVKFLEQKQDVLKPKRLEIIEKCFYSAQKPAAKMIFEYICLFLG